MTSIKSRIYKAIYERLVPWTTATAYWDRRYKYWGDSGSGSTGENAKFKAQVVNEFVDEHEIGSVIEFGCGDGKQLAMMAYPSYRGFDISGVAVEICKSRFISDDSKEFWLIDHWDEGVRAELTVSLDVLQHIVDVYEWNVYMNRLFDSSKKYVIIYSSSRPDKKQAANYIYRRGFTAWVTVQKREFKLISKVDQINPELSRSDFFIYERGTTKKMGVL